MGILETIDERLERIEVALADLAERQQPAPAAQPAQGPEYLDTPAAAALIGVSKQSLALWRSKGTGPSFTKFGGIVRYARAEVLDWMKENQR